MCRILLRVLMEVLGPRLSHQYVQEPSPPRPGMVATRRPSGSLHSFKSFLHDSLPAHRPTLIGLSSSGGEHDWWFPLLLFPLTCVPFSFSSFLDGAIGG